MTTADPFPPCRLVAVPVQLAMMETTNGNREPIADLAPERAKLGKKAQVAPVGRRTAAQKAWLPRREFAVLVALANGLGHEAGSAGVGFLGAVFLGSGVQGRFAVRTGLAL